MSFTPAKDISKYQGNWQDTGEPIVMIKMSGGDDGLYMDSDATSNYEAAVKAGKAVGGYHFGGTGGAEAEASFFLKAMQPLAENDVYALDVEADLAAQGNVVAWVLDFTSYIHAAIGVWPLVYMNLSTLNAHDWSQVLSNCGLWLADWAVSPDATIPTHYTYVMQQYSDGPNYDHDAWFGTVEQFKACGYHDPKTTPTPAPAPVDNPPVPSPVVQAPPVVPTPTGPTPDLSVPKEPEQSPLPPVEKPVLPLPNFWDKLIQLFVDLWRGI